MYINVEYKKGKNLKLTKKKIVSVLKQNYRT